MAKQEITLQGLDGQLDELILTTNDETANGKLEDCARMLFPQEGETTPRLRFKGFEGEWQKKLLSDCLEISDEKNTDNILVLKMSCLFLTKTVLSIRLSILVEAMLESLLVDIRYYVLGRLYIRNPLFVLNHMAL